MPNGVAVSFSMAWCGQKLTVFLHSDLDSDWQVG